MTESPQDYVRLATALAEMARSLLERHSVQATLEDIVGHAVELIDGCDAAGIVVIRDGEPVTLAATDDVARTSDRLQGQLGEGPCFDTMSEGDRDYRIEDVSEHQRRWPRYVKQLRKLPVGSIMGFLLFTQSHNNLGALNLYSARRGAFDKVSQHAGWVLASHAAVALYSSHHVENMDAALMSSRRIGEAIGVVMSRYKLTEDQAFDAIRQSSQTHNVKVRDLADTILLSGELPA